MSNVVLTRIKRIKSYFLLVCATFILNACATRALNIHRVLLDDNIGYVLQPIPENLMNTGIQALFTVKQLKLKHQGKENQFVVQVEMTQSHLLVSGMTVEGISLFTLDWHTKLGTLSYDKKIAIEPLRVLAELQLVLWPLDDVAQGLERAKMNPITETYREISSANEVIYQIKQQSNASHLINLKKNYSIEIEELDRWQLSVENGSDNKLEQSLKQDVVEN